MEAELSFYGWETEPREEQITCFIVALHTGEAGVQAFMLFFLHSHPGAMKWFRNSHSWWSEIKRGRYRKTDKSMGGFEVPLMLVSSLANSVLDSGDGCSKEYDTSHTWPYSSPSSSFFFLLCPLFFLLLLEIEVYWLHHKGAAVRTARERPPAICGHLVWTSFQETET